MPESIELSPLLARDVGLSDILSACSTQNGKYPHAGGYAAALCTIAIGLRAARAQNKRVQDDGGHIPPELLMVADQLFDLGATEFASMNARVDRSG